MKMNVNQLRDVDIIDESERSAVPETDRDITIVLTEYDGNCYGSKTEIEMPAKSYAMLEEAVVEKWLAKKNAT
jgi:hypothetical protein